jgi:hypothetical protein
MSAPEHRYASRRLRSRRGLIIMAVMALVFFIGRILWANGLFSSAPTGFLGSCKLAASVPGVEDIEIANGVTFVSVASARGPDGRDGIYVLGDDGKLTRLGGTSKDFHPRGISIARSPDGTGLFLLAVNRRASGRFSINTYEVTNPGTNPALVAQGTIEGGLLTDPQDVAGVGPGAFYVSNDSAKQAIVKTLAGWGVLPASDILFFNGMSFKPVVENLYDARGLLMAPDGHHLLVASLTARSLKSFSRDPFSGNLTEAGSLTLSAAPEKLSLDAGGEVLVAGHASLWRWRGVAADPGKRAPSQIFRVSLLNGEPQEATPLYGNGGGEIAGAGIGASIGKRLLIGSSLDNKLLDCTTP